MYFEELWHAFSRLPQIQAIALGGSRAGSNFDEKSDYDLYLYCSQVPDPALRQEILEQYCSYIELGNNFWELEDDCRLKNGIDIDILYRSLDDFQAGLAAVVEQGEAHNGYTTCMWHNLLNSRILYDENGQLAALKARFSVPYPENLQKNIILRNRKLLSGFLPSYDGQVQKAVLRRDQVAINHRIAAFMESYFDIIFAMNGLTHPGEKRMVELAEKNARLLPNDFADQLQALFAHVGTAPEQIPADLKQIVSNLDDALAQFPGLSG